MKIRVLFSTLKYLKLKQFFYRLKSKLSSSSKQVFKNVEHKNIELFIDGLHSDEDYLKRFETSNNGIKILNEIVELNYNDINKYSPLIRFNIEYFEYAIIWAQKGIPFDYLKTKWEEYIRASLPLQPYVISLQIPNMLIAMNIYNCYDQEIYDELYSRYRWLIKHQEKHLLANHYFENLKAIVISSFIFNDDDTYRSYKKKLFNECKEEILEDGVHFELSPMYHKIILEDLLLVKQTTGTKQFDCFIQSMLNAMFSLELGFNRTPLFNDSGDNVAKPTKSLINTCKKMLDIEPIINRNLCKSGYYKVNEGVVSILLDAGKIGPDYNPGHSHCDCLSFELCVDGEPVLVNSGTYQYQGDKRQFFRSTSAHNTLMIGDHEQSELWGEHRAGRRIKRITGNLSNNSFAGSYLNQFKEKHFRSIVLKEGKLSVLDHVEAEKKGQIIKSFLHLAPGYSFETGCIINSKARYKIELIDCSVRVTDSVYSDEFGKLENNKCLVFEWLTDEKDHGYIINLNNKENKNG